MKIFFIINPVAGNGKTLAQWNMHREEIFTHLGKQDFEFTKYQGHATEIAKRVSSEDYDAIVSVGGDGTLNEIINGIDGKPVSIIPFGTGSDFGKTIGIRGMEDFIGAIKKGRRIHVDLPLAEFPELSISRYFINILEIGFGAEVMSFVNRHKSFGKYSFIFGILLTLSKMKKFDVSLVENDHEKYSTIEIIVANGKYFGGGMLASPDSNVEDGLLDVHILKPVSRIKSIVQLRSLINGEYIKKGYSFDFKSDKIYIEGKGIRVEMDGETVGRLPVRIYTGKKKVDFIVP